MYRLIFFTLGLALGAFALISSKRPLRPGPVVSPWDRIKSFFNQLRLNAPRHRYRWWVVPVAATLSALAFALHPAGWHVAGSSDLLAFSPADWLALALAGAAGVLPSAWLAWLARPARRADLELWADAGRPIEYPEPKRERGPSFFDSLMDVAFPRKRKREEKDE